MVTFLPNRMAPGAEDCGIDLREPIFFMIILSSSWYIEAYSGT